MFINFGDVDSFANIFSHCVSYAVQKLLSLMKSHLFIFVFTIMTLRGGSEKMLAVIYVRECLAYVFL